MSCSQKCPVNIAASFIAWRYLPQLALVQVSDFTKSHAGKDSSVATYVSVHFRARFYLSGGCRWRQYYYDSRFVLSYVIIAAQLPKHRGTNISRGGWALVREARVCFRA